MSTKIIFLIGAAGSGKSTVGKFLASKLNYCYLDKDIIANRFTGALLQQQGYEPTERDQCDYYKNDVMPLEYDTLLHIAAENLKIGNSVILDAPFLGYFNDPEFILKSQKRFEWGDDVIATVLNVFMPPEVLKQRIITRNNPRDTWKLENWQTFIDGINQKKCMWQAVKHIYFDNSAPEIDEHELLSKIS